MLRYCCVCAAVISPPQKPSLALAKMYCNRNGYETCFKFARVEMLLFCHRVIPIRSPILHDSVVLCAENRYGKCTRRGSNLYVLNVFSVSCNAIRTERLYYRPLSISSSAITQPTKKKPTITSTSTRAML